jgi:hypothetical protein
MDLAGAECAVPFNRASVASRQQHAIGRKDDCEPLLYPLSLKVSSRALSFPPIPEPGAGSGGTARVKPAPSQELLVIRQNPKTGERSLDFLKWGLIRTGAWTRRVVASRSMPRPRRSHGADVPGCLCPTALHSAGRWLLRVEGHQRAKGEAAFCHRNEGWKPVRHRRALGELEGTVQQGMGPDVRNHHSSGQRVGSDNSRPDACYPAQSGLRPVAGGLRPILMTRYGHFPLSF